jgi:lipopolysaccharide biosynthesis protein
MLSLPLATMSIAPRIHAYYLPQFHPIPENDRWWGKGFTEWTNVAKARPLYRGHWQPRLPADLGFYDLRVPEVREAQAAMASEHGIEAFCYYHYWFGDGRQLLERPLNEVITTRAPDFPFSLCWANHTWSGIWYGAPNTILMEQQYPGREDLKLHFEYLLRAFQDARYVTVDGKPLFQILSPSDLPDARQTTDTLRELAHQSGMKGLYLVAGYFYPRDKDAVADGFDGAVSQRVRDVFSELAPRRQTLFRKLLENRFYSLEKLQYLFRREFLSVYEYQDVVDAIDRDAPRPYPYFPCTLPNWDNTPRSGVQGIVVENSTPELFRQHLQNAASFVHDYPVEERFVFVKSWNEWAEGNYLEPDTVYGMEYLEAVRSVVTSGLSTNA